VDIAAPAPAVAVVVDEAHQKMKRHPFSIFFFFFFFVVVVIIFRSES
jgi:Na+/melibiose symporter-like transporter